MFEVVKNIRGRRSENEKGITLTFRQVDQRRFAKFQEAKRYADQLSRRLEYGQNVYIIEDSKCIKYYAIDKNARGPVYRNCA